MSTSGRPGTLGARELPSRREALASAVAYALLFAFFTREWIRVAAHSSPPGNPVPDAPYVTWILWWVAHALTTAPSTLYDAPIFHPSPHMLTASTHLLSSQLVFAPVWAATDNPVLAANVVSLLSYPLAAFAMDRLLRALGLGVPASWVGGLAFALGPWRVPGSNQLPQMLSFFPPAVILALVRMREAPAPRRLACFGLLLLLALFSSYYMALLVVLAVATWTGAELLRDRRDAGAFVARVVGIGVACSSALLAFSLPWLRARPAPGQVTVPVDWLWRLAWPVRGHGLELLLGLAGTAGLFRRRLRFPAGVGLALVAVGTGLLLWIAILGLPPWARPVFGFFRTFARLQILTSFGMAILAGCALETVVERWGERPGALVAAAAGLALAWTLGPRICTPAAFDWPWNERGGRFHLQHPGTADAAAYRRIGEIARREGGGPLVEVGIPQWDTMVDATWHEMPLVGGFTTLWPPQYFGVLGRLGSAEGLDELVDVSHLRWVVFPPTRRWTEPVDRDRLLRDLLARPRTRRFDVGDFTLVRLDRPPARPAWYDTLAAGRPLSDLPPEDAEAISRRKALEALGAAQPR